MTAGSTYTPIATQTLGSSASTVTFSSIPSTYTDLVLIITGGDPGSVQPALRFNSDSSNHYSYTNLTGSGSVASSNRNSNGGLIQFGWDAYMTNDLNYNAIISIMNYSNTTTYKTIIGRANNSGTGVGAHVGLWFATPQAISTITILQSYGSSNFNSGSTFTLYGIASA